MAEATTWRQKAEAASKADAAAAAAATGETPMPGKAAGGRLVAGGAADARAATGTVGESGPTSLPKSYAGAGGSAEAISDVEHAAPASAVAMGSFADDIGSQIAYFAKRRKLPVDRYGYVNGRIVYEGDDGQLYKEIPDWDWGDPRTWLHGMAAGTGQAITGTGSVAGTVVGAGVGPWGAAAGSMLGAGAGEAVRQGIGYAALDDPYSGTAIVREGVLGLAGELAGTLIAKGVNKVLATKTARRVAEIMKGSDKKEVDALRQAAKEVGIDLTPAELTNLTRLRGEQRALSALPQSAGIMDDYYATRGGQISEAVDRYLRDLSPVDSGEVAGEMARGGAKAAMDDVVKLRTRLGSPAYRTAFASAPPIDTRGVLATLDGDIAKAGMTTRRYLEAIRKELIQDTPGGPQPLADLELLHNKVKVEIDNLIGQAKRAGHGPAVGRLTKLQHELLKQMDAASPDYQTARALWGDLTGPVKRVEGGLLAGVADVADPKLGGVGGKLLGTSGPRAIAEARSRMLKLPDGQERWDAVLRSYLESTFRDASSVAMSNISKPQMASAAAGARWWAKLFGNTPERARLQAAMSPKQFQGLKKLMDVLEATGRAMDLNSDTAFKQEALREMRSQVGSGFVGTLSAAADPAKALRLYMPQLNGFYKELRFGKNVEKLAKIITSPGALDELAKVRMMSSTSAKAIRAAGAALGTLADDAAGAALGGRGPDRLPLSVDPGARIASPAAGLSK